MLKKVWLEKSKIKNIYPYLTQDIVCDCVVIGGGIGGAITAFVLASEGREVVVIDKNIIGYKNTSNCSGCITDLTDELYIKNSRDEIMFRTIKKMKESAIETLKIMLSKTRGIFNNSNYLLIDTRLFKKKALNREVDLRNKVLENSRILKNEENIKASNIVEIQKGAYNINPYMFTQSIFEYLTKNLNVRVFENTDVNFIESNIESVSLYTQNDFVIKAKNVVLTTPIENMDFVSLNPNIEIYKRFSLVCNNAFKENMYAKILNDIPLYIRNDKEKLILSGNDTRYTNKMSSIKYQESLSEETKKKFENTLLKLFPKYNIVESNIYSSNIIKTKDDFPIISEIDNFPNVYINVGSGGNGIMQSIVGANVLKDVVKGYYPKEMSLFKLKRF